MTEKVSRCLQVLFLSLGLSGPLAASDLKLPLSTQGRYIVDQDQQRFKLKSVNWYGASLEAQVVAGLDQQPIGHIVGLIKDFGFNSVRLPFSNAMLRETQAVKPELVKANPQLMGKTPLEVYDATVAALTEAGILVILNNHSTYSEWCCGFDSNGLWFNLASNGKFGQSTADWERDWMMLVERYKDNPAVVGADLRNEVRTSRTGDTILPILPSWGGRDPADWHKAAEELGQKLLAVNPDILIVVEGINWSGTIPLLGSGSRPHLTPVRDTPIQVPGANKIVYAAHNYSYIGPEHNGEPKVSKGPRYSDMSEEQFRQTIDNEWGFVLQPGNIYTAPVWISEFGIARDNVDEADKVWFRRLIDYMIERDTDFAYWPLNHEAYGLVNADWSKTYDDDWRIPELKRLLASGLVGQPPRETRFSQLDIRWSDDRQLSWNSDWLGGAHKGSCPDGLRINGLSRDHRALCTDTQAPGLTLATAPFAVSAVYEQRVLPVGDWAGGFTKYECPDQQVAIGFSKHEWGTSGLLCAPSQRPLSYQACSTRWFDRGDQRASLSGGDFAVKSYKGQCADSEFVAGIAQRDGKASALLCCPLN